MTPFYQDKFTAIYHGHVKAVLKSLADCSIDSSVTDGPYELNFMNRAWDRSGIVYDVEMWADVLRVLKPGGHLLSFGGTRTAHRMACAIEDAGFEIRDSIHWSYGSGFPKSLDVSKAIDKAAGVEREDLGLLPSSRKSPSAIFDTLGEKRATVPASPEAIEWAGYGTALKPAHEIIYLARKPLSESTVAANVLRWGTGALNIDACRIGSNHWTKKDGTRSGSENGHLQQIAKREAGVVRESNQGRWPSNVIFSHDPNCNGTCVEGCPVQELDRQSGELQGRANKTATSRKGGQYNAYGKYNGHTNDAAHWHDSEGGGASRFFHIAEWSKDDLIPFLYCAKASRAERERGLDGQEIVSVEYLTWEGQVQKVQLRVDTAQSPPKVIAVSGTQNSDASEWSMFLFGNDSTARSLLATKSTIRTKTNSITESRTLNYLARSLTSDSTAGASGANPNGGNPAEIAESSIPHLIITNEKAAYLPGVSNAALPMQLRINGNASSPANHPTVKPIKLFEYLIKLVTPKGGITLDCFCGSGSSLRAAERNGFRSIGIDLSVDNCEISAGRITGNIPPLFRTL